MRRELALALELDRRVAKGGATETTAIPEGCVIRNTQLPRMRHLNEVVLDAPLAAHLDAAAVTTLARRHLRGATDWFVRIDDEAGATRLEPDLTAAGWTRGRTVLMVRAADPAPTRDPRARRLTRGEHDAVMLANFAAADYGADAFPELASLLLAAQRAMLDGTPSLSFGAGDGESLASMCQLFLDPDVNGVRMAMVEEVGTLPAHRERGLAKAVVSEAIAAARAWGAQMITVPADADDWPQIIYAGLGFAPVGTQLHFTLRGAGA